LTLLLLYVGLAVGVSFLCSLLEASLLSVPIATLIEQRDRGSRRAALLLSIKQERIDDAISAILTLNTIANTLGATLAGAEAARVFGSAWIGLFSGGLALLILVVAEIIPKTLGAVYARNMTGFVSWTLQLMIRGMAPILFLSRSITRLLTPAERPGFSRGEFAAVISAASQDGAISRDESKLFSNLLRFREVRVADVMTPRTVAFMLPVGTTVAEMLVEPDADVFSRIPLYREERDNVVGYVLQRDVLRAVARDCDRSAPLERFMRSISFIPEVATVDGAMTQILRRREPIAMVTDEHGGVEGLITLEDLTETILGVEIVDESDRIVDMRRAALRLRDARLERMRQIRTTHGDEDRDSVPE